MNRLLICLGIILSLLVPFLNLGAGETDSPGVDVRCYTGNPALLEFYLTDKEGVIKEVELATEGGRFLWEIPDLEDRGDKGVELRIQPFLKPGSYDFILHLKGKEDFTESRSFRLVFTDFVWGRDNFSFANDGEYEKLLGSYSAVLFSWLMERFGEIPDWQRFILVHYMYSLFSGSTGNCYAFSGSMKRYHDKPELLPWYYRSIYGVYERSTAFQKEMHHLQMDMVFDHFVIGGYSPSSPEGSEETPRGTPGRTATQSGLQGREETLGELEGIKKSLEKGRPVVMGLMAPDLHHSLLVYGYLENHNAGTLDLLAANNWNREQNNNLFSKDADNLRFHLSPDREGPLMEWSNRWAKRRHFPERIFVVGVRDNYSHSLEALEGFLEEGYREVFQGRKAILVVEKSKEAWLELEDKKTGFFENRTVQELEGIVYYNADGNHLFEISSAGEYLLRFADSGEAAVFYVIRRGAGDFAAAWKKTQTREGEEIMSLRVRGDSLEEEKRGE